VGTRTLCAGNTEALFKYSETRDYCDGPRNGAMAAELESAAQVLL